MFKHVCPIKLLDDGAKTVPIALRLRSGNSYPWDLNFCHQLIALGKLWAFANKILARAHEGHRLRGLCDFFGTNSQSGLSQALKSDHWSCHWPVPGLCSPKAEASDLTHSSWAAIVFSPQLSLTASFFLSISPRAVVHPCGNFPSLSYFIICSF